MRKTNFSDSIGITELMNGLYVANTYFMLSNLSYYFKSALFLHDSNNGGQNLIINSLIKESCFDNYLYLGVSYNLIYMNDIEIGNKLFTNTGSMLIICDRYSYGFIFATGICKLQGKEFDLNKLKEMIKITPVEEEIFKLISMEEKK